MTCGVRAFGLIALTLGLGGCFDPIVAGEPILSCGADEACPEGLVCNAFTARCFPDEAVAPPVLTNGIVTPAFVALGGEVRATFVVDSALAVDPVVALSFGDDGCATDATRAFALDGLGTDRTAGTFAFTFRPDSREPEETASVRALLVSPSGASTCADAGTTTLDYSGAVTTSAVADAAVADAAPVRFTFTFSEPVVKVTGEVVLATPTGSTATALVVDELVDAGAGGVVASWDPVGNEPQIDARIDLVVTDRAGNVQALPAAFVIPVRHPGASPCLAMDVDGTARCTDFDDDGHFGGSAFCAPGQADDCDDSEPLTFPGAVDIPGDGRDNDCAGDGDALIDEGSGIFMSQQGNDDTGDGTRALPYRSLVRAAPIAVASSKMLFLQVGQYALGDGGQLPAMLGGLDDTFAYQAGARARIDHDGAARPTFARDSLLLANVDFSGNDSILVGAGGQARVSIQNVSLETTLALVCGANLEGVDTHLSVSAPGAAVRVSSSIVRSGVLAAGDLRVNRSSLSTLTTGSMDVRDRFVVMNSHVDSAVASCVGPNCSILLFHVSVVPPNGVAVAVGAVLVSARGSVPGAIVGAREAIVVGSLLLPGAEDAIALLTTRGTPFAFSGNAMPLAPAAFFLRVDGTNYRANEQGAASIVADQLGADNVVVAPAIRAGDAFHLEASSPLVDAAPLFEMDDPLALNTRTPTALAGDFDGDCRYVDDGPDVGADEVVD
jgi:hypothetical protein